MLPLIWPLKTLVVPCCGATVSVAREPELMTLPVAADAAALPPSPAMVRLWPLRSNLPVSIGEMMIWLLVVELYRAVPVTVEAIVGVAPLITTWVASVMLVMVAEPPGMFDAVMTSPTNRPVVLGTMTVLLLMLVVALTLAMAL